MQHPIGRTLPRRRLRILVVDDNLDQVHSLAYLLKDNGHHVDYAINGIVALELAARIKPEVVLLDIFLPDGSGLKLVDRFRRISGLEQVHIIGITGLQVDRAEVLAAGFDKLLTKPLDVAQLELTLASL